MAEPDGGGCVVPGRAVYDVAREQSGRCVDVHQRGGRGTVPRAARGVQRAASEVGG